MATQGSWEELRKTQPDTEPMPQIEQKFGMASPGEPMVHFTTDFSGIRTDSSHLWQFSFFGGKPTDGNSLCCLPWACPALYRCFNPTFAHPTCLSQMHSPSFLSEVTNVVATHCGCSHVADEPKQLIPCFKKYKWHPKSLLPLQDDSRGNVLSS